MRFHRIFVVIFVLAFCNAWAFAQERKALSVADVEFLLKESISPKRLAELIEELGVNFKVTKEVRERLKKAGADSRVMLAVERAGSEFSKRRMEEKLQRVEEEKKRLEERRKVEEEDRKRRAEREKRRIKEARRRQEERREEDS